MKIKLLFLFTLISFSSMFAQSFEKLLYAKRDRPTVLMNKIIIANFELIENIPNSKVISMEVMKSPQKTHDQYANNYPNLSQYGLILVEMTYIKLETKTQHEIREFLGADLKTKIYVDGFLLMNDTYIIATSSINEIEIISPNEQDLNEDKVINVWTLPKETRLESLILGRNTLEKEKNYK